MLSGTVAGGWPERDVWGPDTGAAEQGRDLPLGLMSHTLDRWKPAITNAVSGVLVSVLGLTLLDLGLVAVVAVLVVTLGWGWWVSPLRQAQPHVDHATAQREADDADLVVYWRPGCHYCQQLWRGLDQSERDTVAWVNVMADAAGGSYIRHFHDGDMVTPTAVTGDGRQLPATAETVSAHLGQRRTA